MNCYCQITIIIHTKRLRQISVFPFILIIDGQNLYCTLNVNWLSL
jgi:hypothetical protein